MANLFLCDWLRRVKRKLCRVQSSIDVINERISKMSAAMDRLTEEVGQNTTVIESALVLIRGFKAQLDAAITDQTKLIELAATLDASEQALAAAVAENTPAPPPAPPLADEPTV